MTILSPKYVALDSATLGKIAKDHWSSDATRRASARGLIEQLRDAGVYIVVTYTHLGELLRHDDDGIARARLAWLNSLPMIAWVRSHDGNWWVGGVMDIAINELSAIAHNSAKDWAEILKRVRENLLETGVGNDMFVDRPELWAMVRANAQQNLDNQTYIASLLRSDYGDAYDKKFKEFTPTGRWPKIDAKAEAQQAAGAIREIEAKLVKHGDKRIAADEAATKFVTNLMQDVREVEQAGGNSYLAILDYFEVPRHMVTPNMTIGEIGELAVHAQHLKLLKKKIKPPVNLAVADVPPNRLPTFTVERELLRCQHEADRVDGSDIGDCYIVPLALYLDAVEVDKRSHDHVRKIRSRNSTVAAHLGPVFRSPYYASIPAELAKLGIL